MNRNLFPLMLTVLISCGGVEEKIEDPKDIGRADQLFLSGNYAKAAYLYQVHLDSFPETAERARLLFMIAKCRMGDRNWEKALIHLGGAMDAGPDKVMRVEIHYRRAIVLNALWKPHEALRELQVVESSHSSIRGRAIREDEFRFRLGVTRIRTGDWKRGKADLARVDRNSPLAGDARIRMTLDAFAVQIARCRDFSTAQRRVDEARKRGHDARAHDYESDFLVLVGAFPRFEGARAQADRLRSTYRGAFVIP